MNKILSTTAVLSTPNASSEAFKNLEQMAKPPTQKQKIQKYESLLHEMNLCFVFFDDKIIPIDKNRLGKLLDNVDKWSYAHRVGNGEISDKKQQELINDRFWQLSDK